MSRKWYHKLFENKKTQPIRKRPLVRLRLEALEDRVVPASFTVTSTADDGSSGTLRYAISQANASSAATNTINFNLPSGLQTIVLTQGVLALNNTHSTTIQGTGANQLFISGNHATEVFSISSGTTVELDNLTIEDGSSSNGGGISNSGHLTIINSTLSGNIASNAGGGIFNQNYATATLNNSILSGNSASNFGGGIYNYNATATLNNSTLNCNQSSFNGGGIWNDDIYGGAATINNSTLSGNSAGQYGGGIYNYQATATVNNSTFSSNTATWDEGGIYNGYVGIATISNSTLSGNTATSGGGIYNYYYYATATISNSTLSDNKASFGNGGGIYNYYYATATVNNSTLSGNTADGGGGGVFNTLYATATINNSTLSDNSSGVIGNGGGGGILNYNYATATINNSTLSGNSAGVLTNGAGGGVFNSNATVTLGNSIVAKNTASLSPDVYGSFNSLGYNLIGIADLSSGFTNGVNGDLVGSAASPLDPKLGSLANNGGPTQTMALLAGSPAIDAGISALVPIDPSTGLPYTTDQRGSGYARIAGSSVDIGAYEVQQSSQTITFNALPDQTYGDPDLALTAPASSGLPVSYTATGTATVYQDSSGNWFAHFTGAGTATITASQAGNSSYSAAGASDSVTVDPRPITVTADPQSKTVGTADPSLTYQVTAGNLVGADAFSGSLARDAGETVGAYTIRQGSLTFGPNYDLTFVNSVLVITATNDSLQSGRTVGVSSTAGSSTAATTPTATDAPQLSATGSGFDGALTVGQYAAAPVNGFSASGSYFDINVGSSDLRNSSSVQVVFTNLTPGATVFWLNGSTWQPVTDASGQTVTADASGTATVTLATNTSSTMAQLTGTDFFAGTFQPTITVAAGAPLVIGSGVPLTATATLAGGDNETGAITFTLYDPNGTVVDTETATVSGDGTYSTPNGYSPTGIGTYNWSARYSGDNNNTPAAESLSQTPTSTLGGLDKIYGVAVDGSGNVYVADSILGVAVFTPGSTSPSKFLTGIDEPTSLLFDPSGNLYVLSYYSGELARYAPGSTTPDYLTGLSNPQSMVLDSQGNLYVVNGGNSTVTEYAPGSTTPKATLTGLYGPEYVAVDGGGNVYVVNGGNETASVFAPGSLTPTGRLQGLANPRQMAVDKAGNLYILDSGSTLDKYTPGSLTPSVVLTGLNGVGWPAFDNTGNLFLLSVVGNTAVFEFAPGSQTPTNILGGDETLTFTLDFQGNLYLCNYGSASVTVFTLSQPETVAQGVPTVTVCDAGGTYNGSAFPATAAAVGVDGKTAVSGSFSYAYYVGSSTSGTPLTTAPSNTGTYTVLATFTSSDPD